MPEITLTEPHPPTIFERKVQLSWFEGDFKIIRSETSNDVKLGDLLQSAAHECLDYGDQAWDSMLAWNVTLASLLLAAGKGVTLDA